MPGRSQHLRPFVLHPEMTQRAQQCEYLMEGAAGTPSCGPCTARQSRHGIAMYRRCALRMVCAGCNAEVTPAPTRNKRPSQTCCLRKPKRRLYANTETLVLMALARRQVRSSYSKTPPARRMLIAANGAVQSTIYRSDLRQERNNRLMSANTSGDLEPFIEKSALQLVHSGVNEKSHMSEFSPGELRAFIARCGPVDYC